MLRRRLLSAAVAVTMGTSAAQACFICDEIVEFDPLTAQCFLDDAPNYIARAKQDAAGRVEVNLTACSPARSVDAFPSFKRTRDSGAGNVAMIYTLEAASVTCLAERLKAEEVTEIVSFDVTEEC